MNVGIVGSEGRVEARAQGLRALPGATFVGTFEPTLLDDVLPTLDVLFVAVPTAEHFAVAEAATKQGVHVFLEWPPATSLAECEEMVRLAEEAGVEVGVSRPLRYHAALAVLPPAWRAGLVVLRHEGAGEGRTLSRHLADAVDLCGRLVGSHNVQRIDAETVRTGAGWPEALACGLRFHNGAYAQLVLRPDARQAASHLYAAGTGVELDADLGGGPVYVRRSPDGGAPAAFEEVPLPDVAPLAAESRAFVDAVAARRHAPVSALDGLHTMRLVERILGKLR